MYVSWTIPKTVLTGDAAVPIVMDQNAWVLVGPRQQSQRLLAPGETLTVSWRLCPLVSGHAYLPPLLVTWTDRPCYSDHPLESPSTADPGSFHHLYSPVERIWIHPYPIPGS
jgi:hypothetical protein